MRRSGFVFALIFALVLIAVVSLYRARPFHQLMATFVTDVTARTEAQRHNIERVRASIDGKVLKGHEVFSLNAQAGPYTEARGFLPERSLREGQTIVSAGGGVCQVASTLFNAARLAGMEILERVPHSGPVHSVGPGDDATVAYGIADLKLKNPYDFPVRIRASVRQQQLKIEFWGKEKTPWK